MSTFNQKGIAGLFITILILAVMFGIALSMLILVLGQERIARNITKSNQSYYTAEAGIEDALLRLAKNLNWSSLYDLKVGDGTSTIEISDIIGGARTITAKGNVANRIRKIAVVYAITAEKLSFYYGAQVGDGGIQMQDSARIEGNVFSNGSALRLGGNPGITESVKIAKNGNILDGIKVGRDAFVDQCQNSQITGKLTVRINQNCTASIIEELLEEIATSSLAISQSQIDQWKNDAQSGGVISGDYLLSGKQKVSLGPKKIEGNLTIQSQAELSVTGTIWVTGRIIIQDSGKIYLDPGTYGSLSGVVLNDGQTIIQNNAKVKGSGLAGSYLMLLSTLDSSATGETAIILQNSPEVDIIYTSKGFIQLQDSIRLRQVSGWGLKLQNKAQVIYEVGLQDATFTSGPGGSWKITSWQEIE